MSKWREAENESSIKSRIRDWLEWSGYEVQYFMPQRNRVQSKGIPDMCAMKSGITYWIETKRPKDGVQSEYQQKFEGKCTRARVPYILATSVEQLELELKKWT